MSLRGSALRGAGGEMHCHATVQPNPF